MRSRTSGTLSAVRCPYFRAVSLPSEYSLLSDWRSATWTVRASSTERPLTVPRISGSEKFADRTERYRAVVGNQQQSVPVAAEDAGILGLAQTRGTLRHRVEHRLNIRRRAAYSPQNLGCRGLVFKGFL